MAAPSRPGARFSSDGSTGDLVSWFSCAGEPFGVRVHAFRTGSADCLSCAEPRRTPAYTRMEPGREHFLREGYRLAIRRIVGRRTSKLPFPALANIGARARSWAADYCRREIYQMLAAIRPVSQCFHLPARGELARKLFGRASTDRGWSGCTGAERPGRFDESNRAVHNNAACLLL